MTKHTTYSLLFFVSMLPCKSISQDIEHLIVEASPKSLAKQALRKSQILGEEYLNKSTKSIINTLTSWTSFEMPLSVCFFDGNDQAREKVKEAANTWSNANNSIEFYFGDGFSPQECDGKSHHIRITFQGAGVSSLIGRDSVQLAPNYQPSMYLGQFDTNPPSDIEFNKWIIHEFGHALGFVHEHQGQDINCEKEYKFELLYTELNKSPYYWDRNMVDKNLRQLFLEAPESNGFDPASIMLYSFSEKFYLNGTKSPCFHKQNYTLSQSDINFSNFRFPPGKSGMIGTQHIELIKKLKENVNLSDMPSSMKANSINYISTSLSHTYTH